MRTKKNLSSIRNFYIVIEQYIKRGSLVKQYIKIKQVTFDRDRFKSVRSLQGRPFAFVQTRQSLCHIPFLELGALVERRS